LVYVFIELEWVIFVIFIDGVKLNQKRSQEEFNGA